MTRVTNEPVTVISMWGYMSFRITAMFVKVFFKINIFLVFGLFVHASVCSSQKSVNAIFSKMLGWEFYRICSFGADKDELRDFDVKRSRS